MSSCKILASIFCYVSLFGCYEQAGLALETLQGHKTLQWQQLKSLYRDRFQKRSPNETLMQQAELRYELEPVSRFDPLLDAQWSVVQKAGNESQAYSAKLSQQIFRGTSLEMGYEHSNSDIPGSIETPLERATAERAYVGARQKLLKEGPFWGNPEAQLASLSRELNRLEAQRLVSDGLLKAAKEFLSVVLVRDRVRAMERALARAQTNREVVASLVRDGFKAKADLFVVEAGEVNAKLLLEEKKAELRHGKRRLSEALFQESEDEEIEIAEDVGTAEILARLAAVAQTEVSWESKKAEIESSIAQARQEKAKRDVLPQLDVGARLDVPLSGNSEAREPTKTYDVSLSIPLVSTFSRENVTLAELEALSASRRLAQIRSNARRARLEKLDILKLGETRVRFTKELLTFAKQTAELEKQKYSDGKSTIQELRRVQEEVEVSEARAAETQAEVLRISLELASESGKLWEVL